MKKRKLEQTIIGLLSSCFDVLRKTVVAEQTEGNTKSVCPPYCYKAFFFDCPTANFDTLSRREPHTPNINHCNCQVSSRRSPGTS